ncbi:hypothetical protein [Lactiplantibacillus pentosus]|uniref:hypothetical protein n=3 Tax=Lactobacillaceae TaxID=33958 RepID=UPI001BCBEF57|nr:hypothetical protein [Lactiplantibacillus pentosus]MCA1342831.1 hypothetical protein [Lactiplantibacillus pentosus]MCE6031090.1 hypothetical protein [Lactiplantibacillus pentosus]MCJ8184389.1 hypothetical protein [Lactiplantibacillus pentosus]MCT3278515.1 hypothetical protein [Lactiplantibacillus pentosus]
MLIFISWIAIIFAMPAAMIVANEEFSSDTFKSILSKTNISYYDKAETILALIWDLRGFKKNIVIFVLSLLIVGIFHITRVFHLTSISLTLKFPFLLSITILIYLLSFWFGLAVYKYITIFFSKYKNKLIGKLIVSFSIILLAWLYLGPLLFLLISLIENQSTIIFNFININVFFVAGFLVLYKIISRKALSLIPICVFAALVLTLFSFAIGTTIEETENTEFYQTKIYNKKADKSSNQNSQTSNKQMLRFCLQMVLQGTQELTSWSYNDSKNLGFNTLIILYTGCLEYWIFTVLIVGALISSIKISSSAD